MAWLLLVLLQYWSGIPSSGSTLLNGNWQSCREYDGGYAERVWEYRVNGVYQFEFHMGPFHEFGLYNTPQDDEHDHADDANLLKEYKLIDDGTHRLDGEWDAEVTMSDGARQWLHVSAVLAGGSRDECESFVILVGKIPHP